MLYSTANYKRLVLGRKMKHLDLENTKLLYNAFVNIQFNYAYAI